ncbi:hypothetical protein V8E36_009647 [Tilletia maclaganii]
MASASGSAYKRIDSSNAKRPDQAVPYSPPAEWQTPTTDIYGALLGSASVMSGAAMLMRQPMIAYSGLIAACAHLAQHKPHSTRINSDSTSSPALSLVFSVMAIIALAIPKLMADYNWHEAWRPPTIL